MSLEQIAEERDILIADGSTDLLHTAIIALQQALGGRDPQLLQVHQWAVSGSVLKAANEITQAHACAPGWGFQWEGLVKVLVQPLLHRRDAVIGMFCF